MQRLCLYVARSRTRREEMVRTCLLLPGDIQDLHNPHRRTGEVLHKKLISAQGEPSVRRRRVYTSLSDDDFQEAAQLPLDRDMYVEN